MSLEADIEDIQSGLKAPKKVIVFVDELNKYAPRVPKGRQSLIKSLRFPSVGARSASFSTAHSNS
jgi:hypothetical protein